MVLEKRSGGKIAVVQDDSPAPTCGRSACVHEEQGLRGTMEDATLVTRTEAWCLYGVFDGHGGDRVSATLKEEFPKLLMGLLPGWNNRTVAAHVRGFFFKLDERLYGRDWSARTGSTATVLLKCLADGRVFVANLGDSRTVLFDQDGVLLFESRDHKPDSAEELARLKPQMPAEPGVLRNVRGVPRIRGTLAVSRAFGDWHLKIPLSKSDSSKERLPPYVRDPTKVPVSACPDVYYVPAASAHHGKKIYGLLACDGLWDVLSTDEAISLIAQDLKSPQCPFPSGVGATEEVVGASASAPDSICKSMVRRALERGSTDNVTTLVCRLF